MDSIFRQACLSGALSVALAASLASPAPAQIAPPPAAAQVSRDTTFDLSVANIMRGERLVGRSPDEVRWSADSRSVVFRWREPESADTTTHLYRASLAEPRPVMLPDSTAVREAPAIDGHWSADRRRRAEIRGGDVYVVDRGGREWRITSTPIAERDAHLSPDAETVYYLAGDNLFAQKLSGGTLRQLTDVRLDDRPKEDSATAQRKFLEDEQKRLFGVIRDREREKRYQEALDSLRRVVEPTWLGKEVRLTSAEVSPSGRYLLVGVTDRAKDKQVLVANFVTESGYTSMIDARSKVGDVQEGERAGILDLATGAVRWIDPGLKERSLSVMAVGWAPRSDRALLIAIPADYKDRWIYSVDVDGQLTTLDHLRDEAWVGGPGLFTAGWMPDGERVYFVSERSGYAHLYTVPATGGAAQPLTSGKWEVTDVQLSPDGRTFYLTTSETHPGERALYALSAAGGAPKRLTRLDGWNESLLSPDGRRVATLHSTADRPPELFLSDLNGAPRVVTQSTTAEFRRGPWIRPEIVVIPARDGAPVYARIYRPRDLGAQPNGAAVLFVHGAGYLQDVHRGWSSYFREYMFNHLLASRGYTVLSLDYRGSAGYGRDWRTGIYRHMGGKDLSDQVDGVRWLVQHEGVDAARVGLYGGSYGGFITLMALFTEPTVFHSGAALRSVTDWAHYNHWYTSRILNLPQTDPEAYRQSSPIYFAEGLQGNLLMAHGMVDTNVNFQDIVRLTQRLIELGKKNWELAAYPVEDHAFVRADSWTDEYGRILKLFEATLR
jgi:dipeptidyl aminopeptidase/acylaminoacyl peptidase